MTLVKQVQLLLRGPESLRERVFPASKLLMRQNLPIDYGAFGVLMRGLLLKKDIFVYMKGILIFFTLMKCRFSKFLRQTSKHICPYIQDIT